MDIHGHGTGVYRQRAFTVLELLVTLAIAAILMVTGVPTFQHFTWRQHMRAAVGNLQNDLLAARSEAVYRNASVVACPGDPTTGCSNSSDWSGGWIVFDDPDEDRQRQPDETLLRRGQVFGQVAIAGNNSRTRIRFLPDGSSPGSNGTIDFCGPGGPAQARKLVISNIGRIRRDDHPDVDPSHCPTF